MGKIGSTLLTFLFSIPITAVGFMAIFGVPQIAPLNASPSQDIVIRDPYDQNPWGTPQAGISGPGGQAPNGTAADNAPLYNNPVNGGNQYRENRQGLNQFNEGRPQAQQENAPFWNQQNDFTQRESATSPSEMDSSIRNPFGHRVTTTAPEVRPASYPEGVSTRSDFDPNSNINGSSSALIPQQPPVVAVNNPFSMSNAPTRTNTTETSAQMLNWHQASNRLAELGIQKYHLERGDQEGSFLFVCLYQPSESQHVTHRFEAEGSDPLVAVNQVLSQVNNWLEQQYRESHAHAGTRF